MPPWRSFVVLELVSLNNLFLSNIVTLFPALAKKIAVTTPVIPPPIIPIFLFERIPAIFFKLHFIICI